MATFVNDLRLTELATGEGSGTWGDTTNQNLELISSAMGHGAEAIANASTHTITMADGADDEFRSTFLRLTGGGQACTVTLAPNTLSHTWIMRNETNSTLTLTQGSGANVAISAGQTKIVATDGAGSGAVVYELDDLELAGNLAVGGNVTITGDIDVDGTTNLDVVDIDGAVDMASTLAVGGVVTANAGVVVDTITIDGSEIDSSGSLGLDVGGNLTIDVDGTTITLADGGDNWGQFFNSSQNFFIKNPTTDKDIVIQGIDGGSTITALTLDMSNAGAATFNAGVTFGGDIVLGDTNPSITLNDSSTTNLQHIISSSSDKLQISTDPNGVHSSSRIEFLVDNTERMQITDTGIDVVGTGSFTGAITANAGVVVDNITIDGNEISGNFTLDVAGDISFDADGQDIKFLDGGTEYGKVRFEDPNFVIKSSVQDGDILFKGDDGGSTILALKLDMSAAGAATFNAGGTFGGVLAVNSGTTNTVATFTSSDSGAGINLTDDSGTSNIQTNGATLRIGVDEDGAVSSSAIQFRVDGATKATLNDSGVFTCDGGVVVDNITIDGQEIDVSSGDLTIDTAGDIRLDSGGADIQFLNSGTEFGRVFGSSDNFYIQARQADKDIIFQGIDGSSTISALTLDMSQAGAATFNGNLTVNGADVTVTANIKHAGDGDTFYGFHGDDLWRVVTGNVERLEASSSGIIINDTGADADFRVESNGNANMLFVDGGNDRVGIGIGSPVNPLHLFDSSATSQLLVQGDSNDASIKFNKSGQVFIIGIDATDDSFKISDNLTLGSNDRLTIASDGATSFTGAVTANSGISVDNITIDGTEIDLSSGDLTLDVAGVTWLLNQWFRTKILSSKATMAVALSQP